ncbi:c-type cytochrome [Lysinibacillus macroides]|uniref:Cytochrome c domain-containing protein n=1 Tax=Lysinibacillus macroides TaxID=33935 RepID=A0A0M9DK26_9BACI|nr:cytochrome c [Lysinibacillus macroides]KOY82213.1 hypothetical protein ADM90_11280 [Lysinibacillus macroides]QPR68206.1 c-type cytochrome [Lysinibacillus macroides]
MKKAMLTLVFGSAIFLAACGGGDKNASDNEGSTTPDGEAIAMKSCVSCHGGELQGASGPALNDVGSRLSESEILDVINNGRPGMPGGLVKGEDAEAVAQWLATQK